MPQPVRREEANDGSEAVGMQLRSGNDERLGRSGKQIRWDARVARCGECERKGGGRSLRDTEIERGRGKEGGGGDGCEDGEVTGMDWCLGRSDDR